MFVFCVFVIVYPLCCPNQPGSEVWRWHYLCFSSVLVSLVLSFLFELSATNLVVKSEGGIVDEASLELHVTAEPAKEAQHFET